MIPVRGRNCMQHAARSESCTVSAYTKSARHLGSRKLFFLDIERVALRTTSDCCFDDLHHTALTRS